MHRSGPELPGRPVNPAGQAAPAAAGRRTAAGRCPGNTGRRGGCPAADRLARRPRAGLSSVTATPRTRPNGDRMKSIAHLLLVSLLAFAPAMRSEEHTSELQSLMRISYAVFCLKKQKTSNTNQKD